MTTCKELLNITNNLNRENIKIEFKVSNILKTKEGKKKLAHQIVAFTNRYGGKLIIGIKDDRSFEGKNIFEIDKDKGIINNIIQNKISPNLNCDIKFLPCNNGDVIIISIPKRKDMPHAYVEKTKGGEIIYREYLIRTPHGIRHISDRQLYYLFKEQEINFNYPFRIIINYYKKTLKIPLNLKQPPSIRGNFTYFLHSLPEEDIKLLLSNIDNFLKFICSSTPYIFLSSLSQYFYNSWFIELQGNNISKTYLKVPKKKIYVKDLPNINKIPTISSLSIDFFDYLNRTTFRDFYIPPNTNLEIKYKKEYSLSNLIFKNEDFVFDFSLSSCQWGAGIESSHPQISSLSENDISLNQKIYEDFAHIQINCTFSVQFKFPEKNFDLFNKYYQYVKTIKKILQNEWDYDKFIEKLPNTLHYSIEHKLNQILSLIDKK